MKTFSFLTTENFRIDVYASNPKKAYQNILSIANNKGKVTPSFIQYHNGIGDFNFNSTEDTRAVLEADKLAFPIFYKLSKLN